MKGPSIRKRKVKIWSVGTGFVHGWLPVAPAAKAILLEDAKPIHTINATIRRNLADAPSLLGLRRLARARRIFDLRSGYCISSLRKNPVVIPGRPLRARPGMDERVQNR